MSFHGTVVAVDGGLFHLAFSQEFFGTLTPVDGHGPTYVEAPNSVQPARGPASAVSDSRNGRGGGRAGAR